MSLSQLERQARRLVLPRGPKAVMKCLAAYAKPDGTSIYPSIKLISEDTDYSERSVQNFLRWLEREGYIIPIDQRGGRRRSTLYHIPLNDMGTIVPQKPAPQQPKPLEQQERFIAGILKKSPARLSDSRREHWQAELARVQGQLQQEPDLQEMEEEPSVWEPVAAASAPAPIVPITPAPSPAVSRMALQFAAEEKELRESIQFRQIQMMQAEPGSRKQLRWQRLLEAAQSAYASFREIHYGPAPPVIDAAQPFFEGGYA